MENISPLLYVAVGLTAIMFISRQSMLGFPCVIFWAIAGGQGYLTSTVTWDIEYFIFFGCMGMTIFSAYAMYGLRERRDSIGEKSLEQGEGNFVDEKSDNGKIHDDLPPDSEIDGEVRPSRRRQELQQRAAERKSGNAKPKRRTDWITITK